MKKGATHADWAVSLGIFLIYTLSLFLLIQPGVEPIFRNENLASIVDDFFFKTVSIEVRKIPLVMTPIDISSEGTYNAVITDNIPFEGAGLFTTDFYVRDSTGNNIPFAISLNLERTSIQEIRLQTFFSTSGPTIVYLYYSKNAYGNVPIEPFGPLLETIDDTPNPTANFTRIFGSEEKTSGIRNDLLILNAEQMPMGANSLCNTPEEYAALKQDWNYPLNKDFQIFLIQTASPQYTSDDMFPLCNQTQPYAQTNVFVQESVDYIMDEFGNKNPIRISMRVW